jgi:hypothetical protein
VILLLAIAALVIPVMAEDAIVGANGVDILGNGIFQSAGNAFRFPLVSNTNYNSVTVGNDKATALGMGKVFGFGGSLPKAQNNLEILKSQNSGENTSPDSSFVLKVNLNQIKAGSRIASASGYASSVNNVKVVDNQI